MGLREQISKIFKRDDSRVDTSEKRTASGSSSINNSSAEAMDIYKRLEADRARIDVMNTCRLMYKTDTRVQKAHRIYARDIVRAGYFVKTKNIKAKTIADEMQKRLGLNQVMEDSVRLTSRDGDSFYEIVVDEELQISSVTRKPTGQLRRNSDKRDQFPDPKKAFWQSETPWLMAQAPRDAIWFAQWQMVHMRWDYDHETRYGSPMFSSATGDFKKVKSGELNIAVRRKLGSAQIRQHSIEGSGSDVEAYKEMNAQVFGKIAAVTDLFSNKKSSLEVHQGDGLLDHIGDVEYHVTTMMAASDVPEELIVGGSNLNRDVLGEKKEEYEETLSQGREWLSAQLIKPLLEREWLLAGIYPPGVDYEIVWRTAKPLTPAGLRDLAEALAKMRLLGVDEKVIADLAAMYLKNVDLDILQDGFDVDQFAKNLQGLSI